DGEQVAVGVEVTAKPTDLSVGNRKSDVWRTGPGLAERQFPPMDRLAPHVDERGPRSLGRGVQGEPVVGLVRLVHADLLPPHFLGIGLSRGLGTAALLPGPGAGQGLTDKLGGREPKEHDRGAAQVAEARQAEKRQAGHDPAESRPAEGPEQSYHEWST